jgi:redox-sensitive bicupin YhaK (pirin superfamily)
MTAGSGVVHSEMPEKEFARRGGKIHGFQLWINLPKKDKMTKPHYQEISSEKIPTAQSADGKIRVKVIAGQSMGMKAAIDTKTPIMYLHFSLQPEAKVDQEIPHNFNTFTYVAQGQGLFGAEQKTAKKEQAVFFANEGDAITFSNPSNATESLELILLGGVPIGEPVKRFGPFVMNTEEELQQAVKDYQNGDMGSIDF